MNQMNHVIQPPIARPSNSARPASPSTAMNRREFVARSTAAAALAAIGPVAHAQAGDALNVGVVGCGGRGTGAARNAVAGSSGVKIRAMADLMPDRLASSAEILQNNLGGNFQVTDADKYTGFGGYQNIMARDDIDLVILATPPGFRPFHIQAAVEAGKHVFMEKPVAVDPHGVRMVIEAARSAKQQGLAMVAGTQRRHQRSYLEAMDAIHNGAIGEVVSANVYWQQGGLWYKSLEEARNNGWTEMEWQLRNWLYFTWLSGDHIVEQHIHNIDVALWALKDQTPVDAYGNGGRQERTADDFGHIFDHFSLDITMPNGVRVSSKCRQMPNCDNGVYEHIVGTKGHADLGGRCILRGWDGARIGVFDGEGAPSPYDQEHTNLVASIRAGEPLNEGERIAQSNLTAIIAREAAYSGKRINYEWAMNESTLNLMGDRDPANIEYGDAEVPPVAIPGQYEMV